ncbi:hypothetical protein QWY77_06045 [Thalassotalea ponticola]|uniref:hypothetical protein n=1 Tax=Thalassotalea ponticola TaxID=1523392 RepID=UPI0025B4C236|nr:hypothetical protein [Thalassotalea ponticola]MDN3652321.1 hypothetical protein [Thalassotalea ponticola]
MEKYVDVTKTAAEVGYGFSTLKAPVLISPKLWDICVRWNDEDTNAQEYQEQETRLWDILFVCGTTLEMNINSFINSMAHQFHILVIPRDGESIMPVKAVMKATGNPEHGTLEIDLFELISEESEELW